jgi:hypothetical protein
MGNRKRVPRRLVPLVVAVLATAYACSAQPAKPRGELPEWLVAKISGYEAGPAREAPIEIWQISYQGRPAFFFISPCCDRFNPLFSLSGENICSPSGGFSGSGDGKCPKPIDRGTEPRFVWSHPASPSQTHVPPRLGSE